MTAALIASTVLAVASIPGDAKMAAGGMEAQFLGFVPGSHGGHHAKTGRSAVSATESKRIREQPINRAYSMTASTPGRGAPLAGSSCVTTRE